jgi:hypothetical protein
MGNQLYHLSNDRGVLELSVPLFQLLDSNDKHFWVLLYKISV